MCAPPLLSCDGGACVDPFVDPDNCNGCGLVCPPTPNATRLCLGGMCTRSQCTPGFADCNVMPSDGCETNLRADPMHCGGCGVFCQPGQQCDGGTCG